MKPPHCLTIGMLREAIEHLPDDQIVTWVAGTYGGWCEADFKNTGSGITLVLNEQFTGFLKGIDYGLDHLFPGARGV